jgi:hypothetical protein
VRGAGEHRGHRDHRFLHRHWGAILTTFALGTAAGDLATEALSLGFRNGVLIFGGLTVATWIAYKIGAGQVLTFWVAYVLTRPLGASMGDLLTQDKQFGGLALGASATSVLFFAVILVLVTRGQLLEVAWDDAEAGLKPRDAGKWHTLDGQIDDALSALRAGRPSQSTCSSALATLLTTLNKFDGV